MNHSIRFLTLAAAISLTGCDSVSFLFPLTEDPRDLATDITIAGAFYGEDGDQWLFKKSGEGRYELLWSDKQDSIRLDASVVRVSNFLFLDVSTEEQGTAVRGHLFGLLRMDGDTLEISWLDPGWVKKKLITEQGLSFERPCPRGDKSCRFVVTAPPAQLQSFLMRNALNREAFGEPDKLRR